MTLLGSCDVVVADCGVDAALICRHGHQPVLVLRPGMSLGAATVAIMAVVPGADDEAEAHGLARRHLPDAFDFSELLNGADGAPAETRASRAKGSKKRVAAYLAGYVCSAFVLASVAHSVGVASVAPTDKAADMFAEWQDGVATGPLRHPRSRAWGPVREHGSR